LLHSFSWGKTPKFSYYSHLWMSGNIGLQKEKGNWKDHKCHCEAIKVTLLLYLFLSLGPFHVDAFQVYTLDKFYWSKEAMVIHVLTSLKLTNGCFNSLSILISCAKVQQTWQTQLQHYGFHVHEAQMLQNCIVHWYGFISLYLPPS
jgi:hypothetical protein